MVSVVDLKGSNILDTEFDGSKIKEDPLEFIDEMYKVRNLIGVISVILVCCDLINRIW